MPSDPRAHDCQTATGNSTCYDIYDPQNAFPIDILFLNPSSPACPSPLKILIVLFAYNLIAIAITLFYAAIRRFTPIREWYSAATLKPRDIYLFIPIGSLVIQIVFTIASGCILHAEDTASDPVMLAILWFARPLATLLLVPVPFIYDDPAEGFELALTDFLYRLIAFGGYCAAAHATGLFTGLPLPPNTNLAGFDSDRLSAIKAGAALGILGSVGSFLFILAQALSAMRYWLWTQWRSTWWVSFLYLLDIHVFYLAGSWLLWAGLLEAVPEGFCPSDYVLGKLAAVWVFAAVFDNLWRGFASLLVVGDSDCCPTWIIGTREFVDEVFGCFPVERS